MKTIKVLSEVPNNIIVDYKQTLKHKGNIKPIKVQESDSTAILFYNEQNLSAYNQFKQEVA
jgi:hypothetical protein